MCDLRHDEEYVIVMAAPLPRSQRMKLSPPWAVISIVFGTLVIVYNELLNLLVGLFFIILGIWFFVEYFQKGSSKS